MHRKKASDFPQELLDLFDGYVHGGISRRQFLDKAKGFAVGGVTAAALFQTLIDHRDTLHASALAGQISLARPPIAHFLQQGGDLRTLASLVGGQAQSLAFGDAMIACGALAVLMIIVAVRQAFK